MSALVNAFQAGRSSRLSMVASCTTTKSNYAHWGNHSPRNLSSSFETSPTSTTPTSNALHTSIPNSINSTRTHARPRHLHTFSIPRSTPHLKPCTLTSRRHFHASRRVRDFHFDTHHFVQRLEREGLNRAQAEGIMRAMAEVIDESVRNMTSNMVTKADQEKSQYTQKVDFAQLKSELQLMEKNDLATMKSESDRLAADLERLRQRLREDITRTQAGVRLDLNLEKGRMREASSGQELKIKEVDTRIEREIAELRTAIQTSKATTLQYLVGFVTGASALLMAYLRFRL